MKNLKKYKKRIFIAVIGLALIIVILFRFTKDSSVAPSGERLSSSTYEESYASYLADHGYAGVLAQSSADVDISAFSASSDMQALYHDGVLETGDEGSVTFSFNVKETGFYNIEITYQTLPGTTSDVQRRLLIDGSLPYDAFSQLSFKRMYEDEEIKVKNNDEIRPSAMEVYSEHTVYIEDYGRRNKEPLMVYLKKGKHTVTMESLKEPVAISALSFTGFIEAPSYSEEIEKLKQLYTVYDGKALKGEAERKDGITKAVRKSSSSININKVYSDAGLSPYHPYNIIYNTIGGDSFKTSGDYISWDIEVPATGLYYITIKGRQGSNRGITSYRRLYVNGVVPYKEAEELSFDYSSDMTNYTLSDAEGEPMLFLLKEGSNTIKLEVVLGAFGGLLTQVEESMYYLNNLYLNTVQLTGTVPSTYIDYEIRKKVPGFVETMTRESDRLTRCLNEMIAITGEKGEKSTLLEKMAIEAAELAKDPESVTDELSRWKSNISALGTWTVNIAEMPLEIDCFYVSGDTDVPKATAGFFKNLFYDIYRFFASFFHSTNEMTAENDYSDSDEVLTVWMVSSGKEQAQILQNMIDEQFIPKYDIPVKLQLIPLGVVLRAALSGNGPDVLVGVSQGTLSDFAMRNALVDLSAFSDFETEAGRFYDSAITGAMYLDGVYGLPEQQNFMMLFYRSDVLDSIGADVPQTWDDVKELIPVLQRNNYDFCMPKSEILPSLIFQNGGDLYKGSGRDYGYESGLREPVAMESFKMLTDFFTGYKLEVSVDFSNRFRTGEMPVGITNYTTYCNLEIFAPEIKGLWSFAPIPGVLQEDGTIDNTYVTDTVQAVIMKEADNTDDAWTFLKWWTGSEAQLQYATKIESIMGTAARYPAADKTVLASLPWSASEYRALASQLEHSRGIPAVPGNYMTTRMISYAFDDVVTNSTNPREAIYLNVKAIDKELAKKRIEFGVD